MTRQTRIATERGIAIVLVMLAPVGLFLKCTNDPSDANRALPDTLLVVVLLDLAACFALGAICYILGFFLMVVAPDSDVGFRTTEWAVACIWIWIAPLHLLRVPDPVTAIRLVRRIVAKVRRWIRS